MFFCGELYREHRFLKPGSKTVFFDDLHMPWNLFCERRKKSVHWYLDTPSALLPGTVRLVPSQQSGNYALCWEGTKILMLCNWADGTPLYRPPIILPSAVEDKKSMQMDAYLDHFKTSILLWGQRRFVEYSRAHRGPSKLSCKRPGNPWDLHAKVIKN